MKLSLRLHTSPPFQNMKRMKETENKKQLLNSKLKNLSTRIFNGKSLVLSQSTPYEVIARFDRTRVRYYAAPEKKYAEPLVFTAPLAINMAIYDLYPYRSLIKYFQNAGFDVYLLDWGRLKYDSRDFNFLTFIDNYIPQCIESIQKHSGSEKISLHGWSMAGIFVLLYTARHHPSAVKNLIVLGSPIDSYKSGGIGKLYRRINYMLSKRPAFQQKVYKGILPKRLLHTPGLLNAIGFKILDPKGWYDGHKQLLQNLDDDQTIHEHATLGNFLNHMVDYPAGINQDMLFNVWLQNPLKNGSIQLKKQKIELKHIDCPLMIGAGKNDQMVTAAAVEPLTALTGSKDVTFTLIPGGHLGLMSSQKSSEEFWPALAEWLDQRSTKI